MPMTSRERARDVDVPVVVTSPATWTRPVVTMVSTATRRVRVLREHGVQDGVTDLVTDLVGVALGDGLGSEEAQDTWELLDGSGC